MSKDNKKVPERGGGVYIAPKLTRTRQVINKDGDVIEETVEKPDEKRKMRPLNGGMNERLR